MDEQLPVLMMNVDGVIYPVGMTDEQLSIFRLFITGLSKSSPLAVLKKSPVIDAHEIAEKVKKAYGEVKIVK